MIFQIPIIAFCIEEEKLVEYNSKLKGFYGKVTSLLTKIGFTLESQKEYGEFPKKTFNFYRPINYPSEQVQLRKLSLEFIREHSVNGLHAVEYAQ